MSSHSQNPISLRNQFVTWPSISKKSGPMGAMYCSLSLFRSRKRPSQAPSDFVMTREPNLARIYEHIEVHIFSVDYLPNSNGKAGSEFVQYLLPEFNLHSYKGCVLNYIHDEVRVLLNQYARY